MLVLRMNRVAQHVKDYWPLWGIVVAVATALTTYVGLPKRVANVEAGQQTLKETFQDYLTSQKEALAEQRGYQKALNQAMQRPEPEPLRRYWDTYTSKEWCCYPDRMDCDASWDGWWVCE